MQEHWEHLSAVFERLSQHGLVISDVKSHFAVKSVIYLGLQFSGEGYCPSKTVYPEIDIAEGRAIFSGKRQLLQDTYS